MLMDGLLNTETPEPTESTETEIVEAEVAEVETETETDVEQTEEVQAETIEDSQEQDSDVDDEVVDDIERSTIEIPDFVPDSFIPPEDFETEEDELDWYRENYPKMIDIHKTEEFVSYLTEKYTEKFEENEKKTLEKLINENNIFELKTKYPEFFKQLGSSPEITEDEIEDIVYDTLSKEFGEDYAEKYNVEERNNPNTLSGKMVARQREVIANLNKKNEELSNYKPMSDQDLLAELNNQYEKDFKPHGIDKQKYVETVEFAKQKGSNLSVLDFYRLQHFQDYVNDAFNKGKTEGKKELTNEFKKSGQSVNHLAKKEDNWQVDFNEKYKNEFVF